MWSNLASKVGTQDWSGALQKIGNAVAPPPDADDEYDEDDDESYEDEDEEEFEDGGRPFGFAGFLARALEKDSAHNEDSPEVSDPNGVPEYGESLGPSLQETMAPPSTLDNSHPNEELLIVENLAEKVASGQLSLEGLLSPENDADGEETDLQLENLYSLHGTQTKRSNTESPIDLSEGEPVSSLNLLSTRPVACPEDSASTEDTPQENESSTMEPQSHPKQTHLLPSPVARAAPEESQLDQSQIPFSILLDEAEQKILDLQTRLVEESERHSIMTNKLIMDFQQKEARLLEASVEEHQHTLAQAEHRHKVEMQALELHMATEKKNSFENQQKLCHQMEESNARAERVEAELEKMTREHSSMVAQSTLLEQRSLRIAEEKVAHTMALLDERDDLISRLKQKVNALESSVNEREEGVEEAEQEVEELQMENEELQEKIDRLQGECSDLREKVTVLEDETAKLGPLQMELTMVREERDRERMQNQSVVQSTMTFHSVVESERDSALAEVRDLKQHLSAVLADLEIEQADRVRLLTANQNLQSALEAFQDERHAEMKMMEEQRLESEAGIIAAHAAAIGIIEQTQADHIKQLHFIAEEKTKKILEQRDEVLVTVKKLQTENFQLRRSLNEAIHRLQTTQEDVIDRALMKNILLDWCVMKEREKRQQVLELMASVLHFTEEEKESVHVTHVDIDSVRSKVVGAIAAPLPPSKAVLEKLEGENVSEKWISFLMAETEDDV